MKRVRGLGGAVIFSVTVSIIRASHRASTVVTPALDPSHQAVEAAINETPGMLTVEQHWEDEEEGRGRMRILE